MSKHLFEKGHITPQDTRNKISSSNKIALKKFWESEDGIKAREKMRLFQKGKKRSNETKRRMSKSRIKRKEKLGYINSSETREKMKQRTLEQFKDGMPDETKEKLRGNKNHSWKGDSVGRTGIHLWLYREFGKADRCENRKCQCLEFKCSKKSDNFDYALLKDKEYERKRENFIMLCRSCHVKYDFTEERRIKLSVKRK